MQNVYGMPESPASFTLNDVQYNTVNEMRALKNCLCLIVLLCVPGQADLGTCLSALRDASLKDTALEKCLPVAQQGNGFAQDLVGAIYRFGSNGVPIDYTQAAHWYQLAAAQGEVEAQFSLGYMYDKGQGVPQDYKEAVRWYLLAAEHGNAAAEDKLGMMFLNGVGVPQDSKQAVKWFRLAADQGDVTAQGSLGFIYFVGPRFPQDYKEAVRWYRKAAEQGEDMSQRSLGGMYELGLGVPQDYIQAHMWYNLAGASGNATATKDRDQLAARLTPEQVAEAQRLAREWKPKKRREASPDQ